ncbi:hypothetical protein DYU05_05210 [Mucilaginibacter terrenus]|uniref:Uncharacterized protein n=1 Tax=Mucilaginibacter terrenus TaxID=2482727 RepID=A0A3E2NVG9_9SPHI|nr:hypothetical protein [Mucilaginibacter terrenus]RFZ85005.1 hypothetical protein DYU05_05210 [Mucilaginibacter terrenus]
MKNLLDNLKNPFEHKSNGGLWVAAIALGTAAAGAAAWYYLKRKGGEIAEEVHNFPYHQDHAEKKRPKSDVGSLHAITTAL